ncbi:MAG: hypothetical protein Q8Q00_09670 [Dehalococcoidia bacterium]|nr:hypothetical protein [Dehalococcoidia bacterium]
MRRLLPLLVVVVASLGVSTGAASADNCDLKLNPEDCANTGWVVAGSAGVLAAGTAVLVTQVLQGRPFTPRDSGECGAELAHLDGVLNRALTDLREAVDARTKVRVEQLDKEVQAAEVRVRIAEARSYIAHLKAEAATAVFTTVNGAVFWAAAAAALSATGTVAGSIAALGIRGWRVSKLYNAVTTHWDHLRLAWQLRPWAKHVPEVIQGVQMLEQVAIFAAEVLEQQAREFEPELKARLAAIEAARAQVDQVWQRREDTYQHCLQSGNLPAGTWHRPQPTYYFDDEGVISGVAY